jgi:drug/metabolite transporter (DMT)-like permease
MALTGEIVCLVLVGALWGCTNPLLRKGSTNAQVTSKVASEGESIDGHTASDTPSLIRWITSSLRSFLNAGVWLPYLLNQAGSVMFYFTLARSDLSLAVPICNGLSLVFSIGTTYLIGERIDQPIKTFAGAALVVAGVAICLSAREHTGGVVADATEG